VPERALLAWPEYQAAWGRAHGGYDPRTGSPLVRGWLRLGYALARPVARCGLGPTPVTVAGALLALGVPVVVPAGPAGPLLAAVLVLGSALADSVDGAVALLADRATRMGQVYDAVADRLGEAAWCAALWRLGVPGWLALLLVGVSWLHEYVRARAGAAGMREIGAVTVAERPVRVIATVACLCAAVVGTATSSGAAAPVAAAAVWALLALVGLLQLAVAVRRALR
jgi:CDP-diacylglycerol--glycerol-3-phosphate 3-phosphatidyltransferase